MAEWAYVGRTEGFSHAGVFVGLAPGEWLRPGNGRIGADMDVLVELLSALSPVAPRSPDRISPLDRSSKSATRPNKADHGGVFATQTLSSGDP